MKFHSSTGGNGWWAKSGYTSDSKEIRLSLPQHNYCFDPSKSYHLWHAEDEHDSKEDDNDGTAKTDVFVKVVCPAGFYSVPGEDGCTRNPTAAKWVRGANGLTCDQVCNARGLTCDASKQSELTTNTAVLVAFKEAGTVCKSFLADGRDYAGTPFYQFGVDNCVALKPGAKSVCNANKYRNSAALCYCAVALSGGNDDNAKKTLKACTGECDSDEQCLPGLKCFQRNNGETIPGCTNGGSLCF